MCLKFTEIIQRTQFYGKFKESVSYIISKFVENILSELIHCSSKIMEIVMKRCNHECFFLCIKIKTLYGVRWSIKKTLIWIKIIQGLPPIFASLLNFLSIKDNILNTRDEVWSNTVYTYVGRLCIMWMFLLK